MISLRWQLEGPNVRKKLSRLQLKMPHQRPLKTAQLTVLKHLDSQRQWKKQGDTSNMALHHTNCLRRLGLQLQYPLTALLELHDMARCPNCPLAPLRLDPYRRSVQIFVLDHVPNGVDAKSHLVYVAALACNYFGCVPIGTSCILSSATRSAYYGFATLL